MMVAYHPMYPKFIHRFLKVMGPKGLANFIKDSGVNEQALKKFIKTKNIEPIAEHIPEMWSLLFEKKSPLQALAFLEQNGM